MQGSWDIISVQLVASQKTRFLFQGEQIAPLPDAIEALEIRVGEAIASIFRDLREVIQIRVIIHARFQKKVGPRFFSFTYSVSGGGVSRIRSIREVPRPTVSVDGLFLCAFLHGNA